MYPQIEDGYLWGYLSRQIVKAFYTQCNSKWKLKNKTGNKKNAETIPFYRLVGKWSEKQVKFSLFFLYHGFLVWRFCLRFPSWLGSFNSRNRYIVVLVVEWKLKSKQTFFECWDEKSKK